MSNKTKILLILILVIAVFFLGWCSHPDPKPASVQQRDKAIQVINAEIDTSAILRLKATKSQQQATIAVHHWHKAKHDTIHDSITVPYLVITNLCDSTIKALEIAQEDLCDELNQVYEINTLQNCVISLDSHIIDSIRKDRRKFWKGFKWGFASGFIVGGVTVGQIRK